VIGTGGRHTALYKLAYKFTFIQEALGDRMEVVYTE